MNKAQVGPASLKIGQRVYSSSSLHGRIVHELGRRIVSGDIAEGETLPNETDLGREFDVSRTALREGIKVLSAKGLLASRTRTGTRVRPRSDWNMFDPDVLVWRMETGQLARFTKDLYEFRCATEPMAASLAAIRATDDEIEAMAQAVADMDAAGADADAKIEPDLRFHRTLLAASRNELLSSLNALIETTLVFSFQLSSAIKDFDIVPVHRDVLDAVRARDSVAASEAMFKLLDVSRQWQESIIENVTT